MRARPAHGVRRARGPGVRVVSDHRRATGSGSDHAGSRRVTAWPRAPTARRVEGRPDAVAPHTSGHGRRKSRKPLLRMGLAMARLAPHSRAKTTKRARDHARKRAPNRANVVTSCRLSNAGVPPPAPAFGHRRIMIIGTNDNARAIGAAWDWWQTDLGLAGTRTADLVWRPCCAEIATPPRGVSHRHWDQNPARHRCTYRHIAAWWGVTVDDLRSAIETIRPAAADLEAIAIEAVEGLEAIGAIEPPWLRWRLGLPRGSRERCT